MAEDRTGGLGKREVIMCRLFMQGPFHQIWHMHDSNIMSDDL